MRGRPGPAVIGPGLDVGYNSWGRLGAAASLPGARAGADHTLALVDFVGEHGIDEDYVASHERFRGLVLFHRTQAAAALALERRRPEEAIDVVREGSERLVAHHNQWAEDHDKAETPNQP